MFCNEANIISLEIELPEWEEKSFWYIAVKLSRQPLENETFALWFGSICPPHCTDHGKCGSDKLLGQCFCAKDWTGLDCQICIL